MAQQLTEPGLQQIASALSKDIPGPEWESLLRQEREHLGEAFGVAFLYGIFGAGSHTLIEGANASALRKVFSDRQGLELAGIGAREAGSISQMALTDPVAAARLHQEVWKAMPIEQRAANSRAAIDRLQLAEAARAGIPGIEPQPDGTFTVHYHDEGQRTGNFASREEAAAAIIAHEQDRSVELARANASLIEQLQAGAEGTGRNLVIGELPHKNLAEWAGDSAGKIAQARARVAIMLRQAGKDMGLARDVDLSTIPIMGMRWNAREPDGSTTLHIALAEDSQPHHVIEEHAEGLAAWLLDEGHVSEQTLTRWLRDTEAGTRSRFLHDDLGALSPALRRQELLEAFSHVAVNNATGRYADSALPSPVRTFFRAFKEMIGQHLRIATDFLRLRREGKVDPHFAHWLDVAGGLDPDIHGPLRPEDGSTAKIVDPARAEDGVSARDGAFSFSLAESTPERDARPITPLRISSEVLPGGKKDWHRQIRDYIAASLQGRSLINRDSGIEIHFNAESKGEAPSKLRREQGYRAATHLDTITEQAIHLGQMQPSEGKKSSTKQIDYFALPVEIDGQHQIAWFNTRTALLGERVTFYEFGLFDPERATTHNAEKNEARTAQGLGKGDTATTSNAPQSGPDKTVGEFLSRIKDTLPAAIKVGQEADGGPAQDASFSIGHPGDDSSSLQPSVPKLLEASASLPADAAPKGAKDWETVGKTVTDRLYQDFKEQGPVKLPEGSVGFDNSPGFRQVKAPSDTASSLHYEAAARLRELLDHSVPVKSEPFGQNGQSALHHRYAWMTFSDGTTRPVAIALGEWAPQTRKEGLTVRTLEVGPVMDLAGKTPDEAFATAIKPEHLPEGTDAPSVWNQPQRIPALAKADSTEPASREPDYAKAEAQGITREEIQPLLEAARAKHREFTSENPRERGMMATLIKDGKAIHGFSSTITPFRHEDLHPDVKAALDSVSLADRSKFHSRCAEIWMISDMLKNGIDPHGTTIVATRIGGEKDGLIRNPCTSCAPALNKFEIRFLEAEERQPSQ
ncbi:hypothetical protein [Luteolibacter sp. LG18]|uniref:LPD3 domain-containing protein n=1 Tax=Luteolibacter sp. LG18 TaxID=2819286 RepID=UPI002B2B9B24|nr:hypothetical protein llg_26640 [Luteolibacter sp. LG18]